MQILQGPLLSLPLRSKQSSLGALSYETLRTILDSHLVHFSPDGEFFILQTFSGKLKIYEQGGKHRKTIRKYREQHFTSSAMMEVMRGELSEWMEENMEYKRDPVSNLRIVS